MSHDKISALNDLQVSENWIIFISIAFLNRIKDQTIAEDEMMVSSLLNSRPPGFSRNLLDSVQNNRGLAIGGVMTLVSFCHNTVCGSDGKIC